MPVTYGDVFDDANASKVRQNEIEAFDNGTCALAVREQTLYESLDGDETHVVRRFITDPSEAAAYLASCANFEGNPRSYVTRGEDTMDAFQEANVPLRGGEGTDHYFAMARDGGVLSFETANERAVVYPDRDGRDVIDRLSKVVSVANVTEAGLHAYEDRGGEVTTQNITNFGYDRDAYLFDDLLDDARFSEKGLVTAPGVFDVYADSYDKKQEALVAKARLDSMQPVSSVLPEVEAEITK